MNRVVIVTHGAYLEMERVVAGNSVRAYYLAQGLIEHGVHVTYIYPEDLAPAGGQASLGSDMIDIRTYENSENLHEIISGVDPGVIIVGYWELLSHFQEGYDVPIVADVLAPRFLESLFQKGGSIPDTAEQILAMYRVADRFICGTERQRLFLIPWLILAGFDCRVDVPIDIIPISSTSKSAHADKKPGDPWRIVGGGVLWPWRRYDRYANAIAGALSRGDGMSGDLFLLSGGYVHGGNSTEDRTPDSGDGVDDENFGGAIVRLPLLPYREMEELFTERCDIGIELSDYNVEREYSSSFRSIEFLRCGLPIICNDTLEIAHDLKDYDAGWSVTSPDDIPGLLRAIAADPHAYREKSKNAVTLVNERFDYHHTISPLLRYVDRPTRPKRMAANLDRFKIGRQLSELQSELVETRKTHEREMSEVKGRLRELNQLNSEANSARIDDLRATIQGLESKERKLEEALMDRDTAVSERDSALNERNRIDQERTDIVKRLDEALSARNEAIALYEAASDGKAAAVKERDSAILERDLIRQERDLVLQEREEARKAREDLLKEQQVAFDDRERLREEKQKISEERNRLQKIMDQQYQGLATQLENTSRSVDELMTSRSWRVTAPLRRAKTGALWLGQRAVRLASRREGDADRGEDPGLGARVKRKIGRGQQLFRDVSAEPECSVHEFGSEGLYQIPARKDKSGKHVAIVTRRDIFPTNHGAAVKIERTARGLSHFVDSVVLITGDWQKYYVFRKGAMSHGVFPRHVRMAAASSPRAVRKLASLGVPDNEAFLYYPAFDWGYFSRLAYIARRLNIILYQAEFPEYARPCLQAQKMFGGSTMIVEHNVECERIKDQYPDMPLSAYRWLKEEEVSLCNKVDSVVVVSEPDRETLAECGVRSDNLHLIPHGVDLELYDRDYDLDVRGIYGIDAGTPVLVYHGIYSYFPNLEAVIVLGKEILPRLKARGVDVKVIALGPDQPDESPHEDIIFTGSVENLAPYIKSADMAAVTLQKGGGTRMKILEYFAASVPVISTSRGVEGIPAVDGEQILVRDSFEEIVDAIIYFIENPGEAGKIAHGGRQFVEQLDWKQICRKYIELIH